MAPSRIEHRVGRGEAPGMKQAHPGARRRDQGAGGGGPEALFDHVYEHGRQEHGCHDLALLQREGTGGPNIGLFQGRQQGRAEGMGGGAGATGPQARLEQ